MLHNFATIMRRLLHTRIRSSQLRPPHRRGQVAVFLLMVLTALAFVFLWSVDIHHLVSTKTRTQNASDAAAMAGARWQGIGLNLVGELNLLHALALSSGNATAIDAITNTQARLLFTAPMMGFAASQLAAKNNGMYANDAYTLLVQQHAEDVRHYGDVVGGVPLFAPPYDKAWEDYYNMLVLIAADGIASGPDNTYFFNTTDGQHILLDKRFYNAVAGQMWCWFYNQDPYYTYPSPLSDYQDYNSWPALPTPAPQLFYNAEFMPLALKPLTTTMLQILTTNTVKDLRDEAARDNIPLSSMRTNVLSLVETWYVYDTGGTLRWTQPWKQMSTEGQNPFPISGNVRSEYDYNGVAVLMRTQSSVTRMTPGLDQSSVSNCLTCTAAAKPFGSVGPVDKPLVPCSYGLVFPSFTAARLIPVDACPGAANGMFDIAWREHVLVDLPAYQASGALNGSCWYCQQLTTWENPAFRQTGQDWLSTNSFLCPQPRGGPGPGGGGSATEGTPHGH